MQMNFMFFSLIFCTCALWQSVDCDAADACIGGLDDKFNCIECKLGCTPVSPNDYPKMREKVCKAFQCDYEDLVHDPAYQGYDVTCNFNQMVDYQSQLTPDMLCSTTGKECNGLSHASDGTKLLNLTLYRQSPACSEPLCPVQTGEVPIGATCILQCRGTSYSTGRRCLIDPAKKRICQKRCTQGNIDCPDFTCSALKGIWIGELGGGNLGVCFVEKDTRCGGKGQKCCSNAALGLEDACYNGCDCLRAHDKKGNKRRCRCSAAGLSPMLVMLALLFSF